MTEQEYQTIDMALREAEKDDTPFVIATGDELIVAGDANKTDLNIHDFEVTFRIPVEEDGQVKYITKTKEYKGVYITPRQETHIIKTLTAMLPFYNRVKADGGLEALSREDINTLLINEDDAMLDSMYDLVGTVLRIDPDLRDYMLPSSVLASVANILYAFPEMVNAGNVFFG